MTNDPKDRHVLAATVAADSQLTITFNLDDFAPETCDPLGVEAIHPDDFLLDLHDLDPEAVRAALTQQAADLQSTLAARRILRTLTTPDLPRVKRDPRRLKLEAAFERLTVGKSALGMGSGDSEEGPRSCSRRAADPRVMTEEGSSKHGELCRGWWSSHLVRRTRGG
jgi:hypothetical protein